VDYVISMLNYSPHDNIDIIHKLHSVILLYLLLNLQLTSTLNTMHLLWNISNARGICSKKDECHEKLDWVSVIRFIRSWSDGKFKQKFHLCMKILASCIQLYLITLLRKDIMKASAISMLKVVVVHQYLLSCSYM
jgi:hypothetical protein